MKEGRDGSSNGGENVALYIDGWRDKAKILDTLDDGCVVIESYGPLYQGRAKLEQWVDAWFGSSSVGMSVNTGPERG